MIHSMGKARYRWQPIDHDGLLLCIKWFLNTHDMQNWTVDLDTLINMPKELKPGSDEDYVALCNIERDDHFALIWVPLDRLRESDHNPIEACMHELHHCHASRCGITEDDEMLVRDLSPNTYVQYCRTKRIKQAEKK